MSWLYENWTLTSEKNGKISCRRLFGQWEVMVGGCYESAEYVRSLWKDAVRRIPLQTKVKHILMLGLAGGCGIETLHRRFPGCNITAVEWDPTMVTVMDRTKMFALRNRPEILLGDATEIIPTLTRRYDLIVMDLFVGPRVPEVATTASFFKNLMPHLERHGTLLVNAYAQPEILRTVDTFASRWARWKFRLNTVALYRHFGEGRVGDPLPQGYTPHRMCPGFLSREWGSTGFVTAGPSHGARTRVGPLTLEKYVGDEEPKLEPVSPRLAIWQPITRTDAAPGWRRSWIQMNARLTGFTDLESAPDIHTTWSSQAQRHLKDWKKQNEYHIVEPSLEDFLAAYRRAPMQSSLKRLFEKILREKITRHGSHVRWFGVRRGTSPLEAGFATLDVPESQQSIHLISFILPSVKASGAGAGMIDYWFTQSKQRGLRFMDFDLFYAPGDPKSWQGFSQFKKQFGVTFIRYPGPLIRWE